MESIVKIGMRHNLNGDTQRYLCRDCTISLGKAKATPKAITKALDLYFKGVSHRKIVEHLKMFENVKSVLNRTILGLRNEQSFG